MENVLIVSANEKSVELVESLLAENIRFTADVAKSGAEARRNMFGAEYDLIIINSPLKDEFGHEIALTAAEETTSGIIMLVKNDIAEEVAARVEDDGVLVASKPISRSMFHQALTLSLAAKNRLSSLAKENLKLHKKIDELRIVDRAKCALIQYLNMTEAQAHRYIEKQAMDMRKTKTEIAEDLLNTYEP